MGWAALCLIAAKGSTAGGGLFCLNAAKVQQMESAAFKFGHGERAGYGAADGFEGGHALVDGAALPLEDVADH